MQSLFEAIMLILNVVWFVMIAHIILSWLISFQVLNPRQPQVGQIWYGLNRLLEPIYAPVRRILPSTPGSVRSTRMALTLPSSPRISVGAALKCT